VAKKATARFIEPMLLLRTEKLPEGADWLVELKLDGYTALAIKNGGKIHLRSRNDNDFNSRYPGIVKALAPMPDHTVIDGEVVALDPDGKPSFNLLQNYGSAGAPLHFFIFDVLILKGKDVMGEPLVKRRELIEAHVLPELADPIRYSPVLDGSLKALIHSVKAQGLEGLIAKRRDSRYEPGLRSGAWKKMRVNAGQELVIAGYTPSGQELRRACHRLLRRAQPYLCRAHAERVYPGVARGVVQETSAAGNEGVPVRQPAGEEGRPMGSGVDGGEDGGMPVAETGAGGAVRVRAVDRGRPSEAQSFHGAARRQEGEGC
jgi:ATP dependent DNA ligase domain